MQIKMSELAHEMADVAVLPSAYRRYDDRLEALKEELRTLRVRVEGSQTNTIGGPIPSLTTLAGIAAVAASTGGRRSRQPGNYLGIGDESGQYALWCDTFSGLQSAPA